MRAVPLLRWFRRTARDLPWRRTRDPYAVWVSEIMLQQTQVTTVIPYYRRWMRRFPTRRALARASLDHVLKAWEGLGYYARARNLHRAAREMKRRPRTYAGWLEVPGVGPYTAAAIASIAHGERVPVFDGNVRRVLSRLAAREVTAPEPLPRVNPGDFNQALMELGQRLCTPRAPKCDECPVSRHCRARALGEQERWPVRAASRQAPHYEVAVGIIRDGDRVFVQRRPETGLLGGLWEFPGGKRERGESFRRCLAREIREETGMRVAVGSHLVTVPHRYSHFSVELRTFLCRPIGRRPTPAPGGWAARWATVSELESLAMPAANRKIIQSFGRMK